MEHVLWHFGSEIHIRSTHNRSQRLSELNLFNRAVKININSIFKPDVGIIKHRIFPVVWSLSHIILVEFAHTSALATKTFQNVHSGLGVHQAESTDEIESSVISFLLS